MPRNFSDDDINRHEYPEGRIGSKAREDSGAQGPSIPMADRPAIIDPNLLLDLTCDWCNQPLIGGDLVEVVLDPRKGRDDPDDVVHDRCAFEISARLLDFHQSQETPIGDALEYLAELGQRLHDGDAIAMLPGGRDAERLHQVLRRARGGQR